MEHDYLAHLRGQRERLRTELGEEHQRINLAMFAGDRETERAAREQADALVTILVWVEGELHTRALNAAWELWGTLAAAEDRSDHAPAAEGCEAGRLEYHRAPEWSAVPESDRDVAFAAFTRGYRAR